jgi:hypothetical protein
MNMQIEEY